MARPPLAIGHHGSISDKEIEPGKFKAWTRYRDADGRTRLVERWGASRGKARASLQEALRQRSGAQSTVLTNASRFNAAADKWIAGVERRRKGSTYDTHRRWLDGVVRPALGDLLLLECTIGRLEDFFEELATKPRATTGSPLSANSRRSIRKVVGGVLQLAVRRGPLDRNPVKDLEDIEDASPKRKAKAYDAARSAEFFGAIDKDKRASRTGLNTLIKFLFFTGTRIGEGLAVRWQEINLTDEPVHVSDPIAGDQVIPPRSVWINGNIVRVTGKGLVRHAGKTFASVGVVALPTALHMMLLVMKPVDADPLQAAFPSGTGGWRDPNNTQTAIRRLRKRIDFPDFVSHIGRKTSATALDGAGQSGRQVADQLRKASVKDTQDTYMGRGLVNPEAAGLIDAFYRTS